MKGHDGPGAQHAMVTCHFRVVMGVIACNALRGVPLACNWFCAALRLGALLAEPKCTTQGYDGRLRDHRLLLRTMLPMMRLYYSDS
jgi:hypothetical protein